MVRQGRRSRLILPALEALFAPEARARILEQLDAYDGPERERVQLAVLKLSEGDELKLFYYLGVAMSDYRDVLFWADNPAAARVDTPQKRRRLRRELRELLNRMGVELPDHLKD